MAKVRLELYCLDNITISEIRKTLEKTEWIKDWKESEIIIVGD